jgi:cytidine deaminase
MFELTTNCNIKIFDNINELEVNEINLIEIAKSLINKSYAPYSNFNVVCVALLNDGSIINGVNIENNSYGATICAERSMISNFIVNHQNKIIDTIILTYKHKTGNSNTPITPCGICRQSISELIFKQKQDIKLITTGENGNIWVFNNLSQLLPFSFDKLIS